MDEAIGFSLALTLPAAAALVAMPFFLIDALFTRGEFHQRDAQRHGAGPVPLRLGRRRPSC